MSSETLKQEFVAKVKNGRLVLDVPTEIPDGTEVALEVTDPAAIAEALDRAKLHESLRRSEEDSAAGRIVDAQDVLARLGDRK